MDAGTCKHFNGTQNQTCQAGVNFRQLAGNKAGWGRLLPCTPPFKPKDVLNWVECDKREMKTVAELKAEEQAVQDILVDMRTISPLIAAVKKEFKGRQGAVTKECPICGGELRMHIAGYNGHVSGKCETAGCVEWFE